MVIKGISGKHFILYIKKVLKENLKMDEKQAKIAEQIKGILVDNLRIPAEELDYDVELSEMELVLTQSILLKSSPVSTRNSAYR